MILPSGSSISTCSSEITCLNGEKNRPTLSKKGRDGRFFCFFKKNLAFDQKNHGFLSSNSIIIARHREKATKKSKIQHHSFGKSEKRSKNAKKVQKKLYKSH